MCHHKPGQSSCSVSLGHPQPPGRQEPHCLWYTSLRMDYAPVEKLEIPRSLSHEIFCLRGLKQCCMSVSLGRFAKSVLGVKQCMRTCGMPVRRWCTLLPPLLPDPWAVGKLLRLCRTKPSHLLNGNKNCVPSLGLFLGSDEKVPAKHPEL